MYNAIFLYYGLLVMLSQLVVFRELSVLFYGSELFLGTFMASWFFWVGLGSLLAKRLLKDGVTNPVNFFGPVVRHCLPSSNHPELCRGILGRLSVLGWGRQTIRKIDGSHNKPHPILRSSRLDLGHPKSQHTILQYLLKLRDGESGKERPAVTYFSYSFLAVSLLFPGMVLLIRASKSAFPPGEFIGPLGTILYTFVVMSVLCFAIGGQFSLACRVASDKIKREAALGRVYLCEAFGAVIGGALFTYALIGAVPTFTIALALSLGSVFISLGMSIKKASFRNILFAVVVLAALFTAFKIEPAINKIEWSRYLFVAQKETRNDTLSLVNMGSIKNVFVDGMLSASYPNAEGYEPGAHWGLLAAAEPGRILIIGDQSLGMLKEALKHDPGSIDYVVPDDSFINTIRPYMEPEDLAALEDPRVHIHYNDPRLFIKSAKKQYNNVIINIPEVPNLKANRFYTKEFYGLIRSVLRPDGILALSVLSSENYLSMQTRLFNASVYRTLRSVFNAVEVIPGDIIMFLSSPSAIDMKKETILGRFKARKISNSYVTPSYIEYKLEAERRAGLKKLMEDTPGAELNKDFKPTTCYYFAGFWLDKFASPLIYISAGIFFIVIAFSAFKKRASLSLLAGRRELVLIFVMGFVGMLLEMILLLGYQVISGYVYWQLGILFASFMSGLFLGSLSGNRLKSYSRQIHFRIMIVLTLIIVASAVSAAHLLPRLIYLSSAKNIMIFTALLALIGSVMGGAFVVAGFLVKEDEIMAKAGSLYASDLWGSALGAMLSTNFIVPVFGIIGALNISAVIGLAGLAVFLALSGKTSL